MTRIYLLLVLGMSSVGGFAQSIPPSTVGQVYNFEVGDSFEYQSNWHNMAGSPGCNSIGYRMIVIQGKEAEPDAIRYEESVSNYFSWNCNFQTGATTTSSEVMSVRYTDLDSSIFWYGQPDTLGGCSAPRFDTSYYDPGLNNRKVNEHTDGIKYIEGCHSVFAEGIGVVESRLDKEDIRMQWGGTSLIYYHKANGEKWGTPYFFIVTGQEKFEEAKYLIVSPNPATDNFQFSFSYNPDPETYVRLYDALGQLVKQELLTDTNTTIDRGDLNDGVYFWQVSSGEKILDRGKLVLQ